MRINKYKLFHGIIRGFFNYKNKKEKNNYGNEF